MAARLPLIAVLAALLWCTAAQGAVRPAGDGTLSLKAERRISFDTDSGSWMSLDVAPDGRRLIFDLLGDLYVLPLRGGSARRLTSGMALDTQPTYSPDGNRVAFVSDRSGAESLWVVASDGSGARQISAGEDDIWVSPEWSSDGRSLFASRYLPSSSAYELWRFDVDKRGPGTLLVPAKTKGGQQSSLGAWPSADGRSIVFARARDRLGDGLASWSIVRRDLNTGAETILVAAAASPRTDLILGSFFKPALSPDGRRLAYASRHEGQTGLRLLDLTTGADRWLAYPLNHDAAEASAWQDLVPRFDFTPSGREIIFTAGARFHRVAVETGAVAPIGFTAQVELDLGPSLRMEIVEDQGPVRARIIQHPTPSPDGRQLAFSALGRIYVAALRGPANPRPLTAAGEAAFMPSWSPDGRRLTYVTWTARDGGHVWTIDLLGNARPRRVSRAPAFYTFPVFARDGRTILAVRSSSSARMRSYMEYGAHRQAELVALDRDNVRVLASGMIGDRPHFGPQANAVYLFFSDGLYRVPLDGSKRTLVAQIIGPGWYFSDAPATAESLRLSPDGKMLLAQLNQQLYLVPTPAVAGQTIDLRSPVNAHARLTDVGADFVEWSANAQRIHWSLGSTFFARAVGSDTVTSTSLVVEAPRDTPRGSLLLRAATLLTMNGSRVIENGDLLVVDNRIAAIGARGSFGLPSGTVVRDVTGRFIMPGLIDAHDHYADIRRGVLDFESWGPRSNLAYGVTTGFDPSTLSIDTLAYQDAIDAGLMIGSRMPSTGPAVFSFNRFSSLAEVRSVLTRYRDHYGTRNLKQYRSGNRRVRQWIAEAARELGMMPTTEGALALKLGLSHVIDGYAGYEHALPVFPIGNDLVELMSGSGIAYTPTLQIGNGGPEGQDYFIVRDQLNEDPKLNRFAPRFVVNVKTRQRTWRHVGEYVFPAVAAGATRIKRKGGIAAMGSHGEMPGIGMHWEMEAHVMGGMSPSEALYSATMGSAQAIGREREYGSLEQGKFADLVILAKDPRRNIRNSLSLEQVMRNGRLYDAATLDEVWPRRRTLPAPWFRGIDVPIGPVAEFPAPPDPVISN